MNAMPMIGAILAHTPAWVFGVFALLLFLGAQAARPRAVRPWRAVITPAVFIAWGLISLATKPSFSALLAGEWLSAAAAGTALALVTVRLAGAYADRAAGRVHLPGSPLPLARNVTIFAAKYGLAVAAAINPDAAAHLAYWDIAVSGLAAGYFFGWLARFAMLYRVGAAAVIARTAEESPS